MEQKIDEKIFLEQTHNFHNEKEKADISIKLEQEEKYILINFCKNANEITHKTKFSFRKIKDNDIEFFYPFNS